MNLDVFLLKSKDLVCTSKGINNGWDFPSHPQAEMEEDLYAISYVTSNA